MKKELLSFNANVFIKLFDENGNLKAQREIHNTVTTAGKNGVIDQLLASPSLSKLTHIELGTGTGGTTKLNSYISSSRKAFTSKTADANVLTVVGNWAAGEATASITEAGTFDSASEDAGNMWMYASFTAIPKGANDTLQITWTLTAN